MSILPTGTVTLIVADHRTGANIKAVRDVVDAQEGFLFQALPEHWSAAFASPRAALRAAVQLQRSAGHVDAALPSLALHTGYVDAPGRDYRGAVLSRARYILDLASPGRILVSKACRLLCEEHDLEGLRFESLGAHRLADLLPAESLAQVTGPGLPHGFAPPRGLATFNTNLPVVSSRFVDRRRERAELTALLGSTRLLTLTGAGGCGKTRLAMQLAADCLTAFPDGVWMLDVAAVQDPHLLAEALLDAMQVPERPDRPALERLVSQLAIGRSLLVLDNVDQQPAAVAALVRTVLDANSDAHVLATGREALGLSREASWRVPPLALPDYGSESVDDPAGIQFAAFTLFMERAAEASPDFAVNNETTPAIADICFRVDGMPLAIELAAAALHDQPVAVVSAELATAFEAIRTVDPRALPPRHQVMRTVLDWRLAGMTPDEARLIDRLAIFAGPFDHLAASAIASGEGLDEARIPALIDRLCRLALMVRLPGAADRVALLDPVRDRALDRLNDSGDAERVRDRHLAWTFELALRAESELTRRNQSDWLHRLERHHGNLRAALDWAIVSQQTETALLLGRALWRFWSYRGHISEGRRWLVRILELPDVESHACPLARALYSASVLAQAAGDPSVQVQHLARAESLFEQCGDVQGLAWAYNDHGVQALWSGDYAAARQRFERSLALKTELGFDWDLAIARLNLGLLATALGETEQARHDLAQALALAESDSNASLAGAIQIAQAELAWQCRELDAASRLAALGLATAERLGLMQSLLQGNALLARLARDGDRLGECRDRLGTGLALAEPMELLPELAELLDEAAGLAAATDQADSAARLAGAADRLRQRASYRRRPQLAQALDRALAPARAALGMEAFASARLAGASLGPDAALSLARTTSVDVTP